MKKVVVFVTKKISISWNCPYCGRDNTEEVYSFELDYPTIRCPKCFEMVEKYTKTNHL